MERVGQGGICGDATKKTKPLVFNVDATMMCGLVPKPSD